MTTSRLDGFTDAARRRIQAGAYDLYGKALPRNGSLAEAIRDANEGGAPAVIAELKPRSPSEGRLLQGPAEPVLDAYRRGGATGISVLADADFFDGSPDLVRTAHATGLPLLWKDFIVDAAQLDAAAHHGASAVLLIERCLAPADRDRLLAAAHDRGLEVLLEVHGMGEVVQALATDADLLGVNARDLDTLDVDLAAAREVVRHLAAATDRPVLALSGTVDRSDVTRARDAGAAGVLVGTSAMRHPFPDLAIRALRRPLAKVCGITDEADLDTAIDAGADLVGFVVGADTPRSIPSIHAQRLSDHAHERGTRTVLVTPHKDAWEVREWCRLVRPDLVQVHGLDTDAEWVHSLGAIPTSLLHALPNTATPPATGLGLVIDTPATASDRDTGGSGQTHDWDATARLLTGQRGRMSLVAGGLDASNAALAVQTTGAWGADASSRLESTPGHKDAKSVRDYVAAVQGGVP